MKLDMSRQQKITVGSVGTVDTTSYFFFLYPFWNHLPLEEENQTYLSKIKYCVKGPKGSEELLSNLGLVRVSTQMRENENSECQRDSN